ncbi:hypothetical protein B484DRAFT_407862 [Ochromonadaceae sp. CCMP2298]|nr:hypothetical protein B484DRAFT_407862 [Ochromonadaceae sp. CCMP2298]
MADAAYVKPVSDYVDAKGRGVGKGMALSDSVLLDAQIGEYMGDIIEWKVYKKTKSIYGIRISKRWVLDGSRLKHICAAAMCNDYRGLRNRHTQVDCSDVTCRITAGEGEDADRQYLVVSRPCRRREHVTFYGNGLRPLKWALDYHVPCGRIGVTDNLHLGT